MYRAYLALKKSCVGLVQLHLPLQSRRREAVDLDSPMSDNVGISSL